jgi:hypothetical protein
MPVPDFSPGEVLTAAAMDSIGLWLVKTQTVGSAVASVTVTDAFNADFSNYKIVITGTVGSNTADTNFQFTGITGSVYISQGFFQSSGVAAITTYTTNTTFTPVGSLGNANNTQIILEISSPNLAAAKYMQIMTNSSLLRVNAACQIASTTQSTGFTLTPALGTITGGTIRVYGYRN